MAAVTLKFNALAFYSGKIPIMESKERPWQDGVFVYQKKCNHIQYKEHMNTKAIMIVNIKWQGLILFLSLPTFITFTTRFFHLRAYDMPFLRMYLWL